jgi:hypothetical protein
MIYLSAFEPILSQFEPKSGGSFDQLVFEVKSSVVQKGFILLFLCAEKKVCAWTFLSKKSKIFTSSER